mgnify:CR=1 FL=1
MTYTIVLQYIYLKKTDSLFPLSALGRLQKVSMYCFQVAIRAQMVVKPTLAASNSSELETTVRKLTLDLENVKLELSQKSAENDKNEAEIQKVKSDCSEKDQKICEIQENLLDKTDVVKNLENQISELKTDEKSQLEKCDKLQAKIEHLETSNLTIITEKDELDSSNKKLADLARISSQQFADIQLIPKDQRTLAGRARNCQGADKTCQTLQGILEKQPNK